MKTKIFITASILICMSSIFVVNSDAIMSPHPMDLYTKGKAIVDSYRGNTAQLAEAQNYFTELIKQYPESPFGYLGMSRIHRIDAYLYDNHYNMKTINEDALPFAIRSLELGSSLREVHENYSIFEKIFDDYDSNRKRIQEHLFLLPDMPETYFSIANLLKIQAEYDKSIEYYEKALELEPSNSLRVKILKRIAMIYLDEYFSPQKAVEYFKEALKIDANSTVLNEYLGIAYLKMDKYELSITNIEKSLEKMQSSFQEYHLLQAKGFLSEEEGDYPKAIGYFEKASKFKKNNSLIHYSLGNLYYKVEDYEKAYTHFKQVIDLSPHISKAYYLAGRAAHSLGDPDLAIDYYRKYLNLNSSGTEADWIRKNIPDMSAK